MVSNAGATMMTVQNSRGRFLGHFQTLMPSHLLLLGDMLEPMHQGSVNDCFQKVVQVLSGDVIPLPL